MEIQKVMKRDEVANAIHAILKSGTIMLEKKELEVPDFAKLKVIRNMNPTLSSAVLMIQQETAQQRLQVVVERMKQLGYDEPKQLK